MNLSESEFLAEAKKYYANMHSQMDCNSQSFYDYEATFVQLSQDFSRRILEKSVGQQTPKERKKKSKPV
jgi:altronate dehydratase